MKTIDQAIEYKSLLQKVKSSIEDIGTLGIDTKPYYEVLNTIIEQVENSTSDKYRSGSTAVMFLEQDYMTGIKYLKDFNNILGKYNTYFVIINTCNYIDMQIKNEISKEDIEKYANKMIELLNSLRYSDTIKYSEEQKIVEKVYDLAYKLIKFEIINFGESKIYDSSKNYDIDLSFFNECIKNELDTINLNDAKYEKLKAEIFRIKSKGIGNSYFDINIIKMIIALNSNYDILKSIKDSIFDLKDEIRINNRNLDNIVYDYKNNLGSYKWYLSNELKAIKKQFAKSLISVILGISFYIGAFTGLTIFNKKETRYYIYDKESITYSEDYLEEVSNEEVKLDEKLEDETSIKIITYGSWNKKDQREVCTYDVSYLDFDTLKEYLSIPLDNLEYESYMQKKGDCKYVNRTDYKEVEKAVYDYKYNKLNIENFVLFEILISISVFAIFGIIEVATLNAADVDIISRCYRLKNNFEEFKRARVNKKKKLEEMRKQTLEIMELIEKNDTLKEKFNVAIEKNRFLLSLDSDLNKEVLNTEFKDTDEIKKLVRAK